MALQWKKSGVKIFHDRSAVQASVMGKPLMRTFSLAAPNGRRELALHNCYLRQVAAFADDPVQLA